MRLGLVRRHAVDAVVLVVLPPVQRRAHGAPSALEKPGHRPVNVVAVTVRPRTVLPVGLAHHIGARVHLDDEVHRQRHHALGAVDAAHAVGACGVVRLEDHAAAHARGRVEGADGFEEALDSFRSGDNVVVEHDIVRREEEERDQVTHEERRVPIGRPHVRNLGVFSEHLPVVLVDRVLVHDDFAHRHRGVVDGLDLFVDVLALVLRQQNAHLRHLRAARLAAHRRDAQLLAACDGLDLARLEETLQPGGAAVLGLEHETRLGDEGGIEEAVEGLGEEQEGVHVVLLEGGVHDDGAQGQGAHEQAALGMVDSVLGGVLPVHTAGDDVVVVTQLRNGVVQPVSIGKALVDSLILHDHGVGAVVENGKDKRKIAIILEIAPKDVGVGDALVPVQKLLVVGCEVRNNVKIVDGAARGLNRGITLGIDILPVRFNYVGNETLATLYGSGKRPAQHSQATALNSPREASRFPSEKGEAQ